MTSSRTPGSTGAPAPSHNSRLPVVGCGQCGRESAGEIFNPCTDCRGDIRFLYPDRAMSLPATALTMWDFADRLPVRDPAHRVSLGEGMTPLLEALSFPGRNVFWKNEGANPTGSQKDRAVSVAISVAREHGYQRVVTASTGSVGVSCAAYCARAGLPCVVLVPDGTPIERLRPMMAFGAKVVQARMPFEEIERVLEGLDPSRWYQASTIQRHNSYQSEGPKTIAFEIVLQLGREPDWLVVPVGGGGTLFGIWKGFHELLCDGIVRRVPRILGVQARAFNLLERIEIGPDIDEARIAHLIPDESVETISRNLKHGFPPDAHSAARAIHASGGRVLSVEDDDTLSAQLRLARREGIFCEPSSAVALVAIERAVDQGWIGPGETTVGIITGSGFRELGALPDLTPLAADALTQEDLDVIVRQF